MTQQEIKNRKNGILLKLLLGIVTVIIIVMMFPKGESIEFEISEGAIWLYDDLIAPFSFPIKKSEEVYRHEVKEAERTVYPVFVSTPENSQKSIDSLKNYSSYLLKIIDELIGTEPESFTSPTFLSTSSFSKFMNLRIRERNLLRSRDPDLKDIFVKVGTILSSVYNKGVMSIDAGQEVRDSIAVRSGRIDRIEPISKYLFMNQVRTEVENEIAKLNYSNDLENALIEYSAHFIFPNLVYSDELTKELFEQARNNVSKYTGIVNENERIVAKHDRITKEAKLKIESYKEAKGEMIGNEGIILQHIGKFIHIGLLVALLVTYIFLFRKKIFYNTQKLMIIPILLIFISFITFLINQLQVQAPVQFLIFIPAASMLFTIIFDSRVGFYSTVIIALILGALRGNDYTFMAMNLIAGGISVYSVRDIKNRSQIFRSFLFILLGYFLSILAFGLERFSPYDSMLIEFAFAASNALISPVLTYGLLIFFERLFKITTDLTLLELSNFDRPLLRDLARKAPGTFNHSMTMGTIAEAAAEKIGANPLLARVGAYYHDIGKTISPQNFVENQLNEINVHENLKPEESIDLILNHVKAGIELAHENNIPQEIVDFIPMHHGTTAMTFFYEKAKKLYSEQKVDVNLFRYPGPKPNTKETAIVMLADGCESAVRSIREPDPVKVENVIGNIFKERTQDGQLEESPVTLKDITNMKEEFLKILLGQHHKRIKYPRQEEMEKGSAEEKKN
ncbi:MAG TPA: HDIG domain-containing protein [Ignavibacteriaceae bacterium]|nr:HDIG domain-containing protein [Ignavibacteriaceae bacterium]